MKETYNGLFFIYGWIQLSCKWLSKLFFGHVKEQLILRNFNKFSGRGKNHANNVFLLRSHVSTVLINIYCMA